MTLLDQVMQALQGQIEQHKLEVLQRYPNDFFVHDKNTLQTAMHKGAKIAWMVGHSHTHLVLLGLHAKENENVAYLTNLANEDRFYCIDIGQGKNGFSLKAIDREAFTELCHTKVPYRRVGTANEFWLYRNDEKVGHCTVTRTGNYQNQKHIITCTPCSATPSIDHAALQMWSSYAVRELAHSLFAKVELVWHEPLKAAA